MGFCHLHVHNEYSVLDGFGSAKAYVAQAKKLGHKYLGLTNHGNVDGLIEFQAECDKAGIKPVSGCELYIVPDLTIKKKGEKRGHVTVFVENEIGWKNLLKMISVANLEGFYYRPRVDFDLLFEHAEGLIISTACTASFLNLPGGEDLFLDLYDDAPDRIFLEIMPHTLDDQSALHDKIMLLEDHAGAETQLLATNDCHYIKRGDSKAQEVLLAIQSKAKWKDPKRWKFSISGLHMRSDREMRKAFDKQGDWSEICIDEAIDNTEALAKRCCGFRIPKRNIQLPEPKEILGYKGAELIQYLCDRKYFEFFDKSLFKSKTYSRRVEEEMGLIKKKGFEPYFLMVYELLRWCDKNDVMYGPGRGSVGGSLVAFLLGITAVDPIKYNLLFSRFISEERIDFPDIDLDFEDIKRDKVRQYLKDRYGKENVAGIATFLRMKSRAVVKDVSRVFDVPDKVVNKFTKTIAPETGIEGALKESIGASFQKKYPEVIELALKLENQIRGMGQHAGGIIVSKNSLWQGDSCAVVKTGDRFVVNWGMSDAERCGLLKLDVLGLNTLSVVSEALKTISAEIDLKSISFDDPEVYKMINQGKTAGVFQINTKPLTNLCLKLKPQTLMDLSHVIALVRPGPSDSGLTDEYIKRRKGGRWAKKHKLFEKVTEDTLGIVVYQEQVMQVINQVAGLPYSTADKIRKVIGKKRDKKYFKPYEEQFVKGCIDQETLSESEARQFWKELQNHAHYSFNRAHSLAYAMLGYWTAWLKVKHPIEFICACLTKANLQTSEKNKLIADAVKIGFALRLPKIGESDPIRWIAKDEKLLCPFIEIKGIGEKAALKIIGEEKPVAAGGFFDLKATAIKPKGRLGGQLQAVGAYSPKDVVEGAAEHFDFSIGGKSRREQVRDFGEFNDFVKIAKYSSDVYLDRLETLDGCYHCDLGKQTKFGPVVPEPGKLNVVIVVDVPNKADDEAGEYLTGAAGAMLFDELKKHGFKKGDFHITAVCKCLPKVLKSPNDSQIRACGGKWLSKELRLTGIKLVLVLGKAGIQYFSGQKDKIENRSGEYFYNRRLRMWVAFSVSPQDVLKDMKKMDLFKESIFNFTGILNKMR